MKKLVKKIKNYYLNSRKKFKHIFYTLETLPILILIIFAVTVISFGGFKNLEEKIKWEYFVFNNQETCNKPSGMTGNWGKFSEYFSEIRSAILLHLRSIAILRLVRPLQSFLFTSS